MFLLTSSNSLRFPFSVQISFTVSRVSYCLNFSYAAYSSSFIACIQLVCCSNSSLDNLLFPCWPCCGCCGGCGALEGLTGALLAAVPVVFLGQTQGLTDVGLTKTPQSCPLSAVFTILKQFFPSQSPLFLPKDSSSSTPTYSSGLPQILPKQRIVPFLSGISLVETMTSWPTLYFMLIQKYKYSEYLMLKLRQGERAMIKLGRNQWIVFWSVLKKRNSLMGLQFIFKPQVRDRKEINSRERRVSLAINFENTQQQPLSYNKNLEMRYLILFLTLLCVITTSHFQANSPEFTYHGRYYLQNNSVMYDWTCFKIDFCFTNSTKAVWNVVDSWNIYHVVFDSNVTKPFHPKKERQITIFQSSAPESHCVEIIKITENHYGPIASYKDSAFNGVTLTGGALTKKQATYKYKFDFMGDSLTTAFGVLGAKKSLAVCIFNLKKIQNCRHSWATHLSQHFQADYRIQAISGKGVMRNSLAIFGKKMPDKFTRITDNSPVFSYKYQDGYTPDILFICLGQNDFANIKDPSPNNFLNGYRDMLQMILNQQYKYLGKGTKIVNVCPADFRRQVCVLVKRAVQAYRYGYKWIYYLQIPAGTIDFKKDIGCDGHPNSQGQQKFAQALHDGVTKILQE